MARIRLSDYCCQGGDKVIDSEDFRGGDLVIAKRGKNTLMFSPLGNQPEQPVLALVGITPGSQSEVFSSLLRSHTVEVAASKAAFAKGQDAIKELLVSHGFAKRIGVELTGDLNNNPKVFTTSLVKCCLKVDGSYKYKAPDIEASPEAMYCVSNRFISDVERYPSLKWIVIFGDSGWEAVSSIKHNGVSVRSHLESKGIVLLNFPHFSQNFQQRAIFVLDPSEETDYFSVKPSHKAYAPTAQRMRAALLTTLGGDQYTQIDIKKSSEVIQEAQSVVPKTSRRIAPENKVHLMHDKDAVFSTVFYLEHQTGDKLYPVRMKNRDTGVLAFRVSPGGTGGNTKAAGIEVEDEHEMKRYVFEHGYAVRASTLNKSRNGLFKIGQRSIMRAVEQE